MSVENKIQRRLQGAVKWMDGWIQSHEKRIPAHFKHMRKANLTREVIKEAIEYIDYLEEENSEEEIFPGNIHAAERLI